MAAVAAGDVNDDLVIFLPAEGKPRLALIRKAALGLEA
jgi:hypothetical protein